MHTGRAELLMKGSLHTDELMAAVVSRDGGLRTERRISHIFAMDVPTYHKTLIVTDAVGVVRYAHETDNYRVRPEPERFLEIVREI